MKRRGFSLVEVLVGLSLLGLISVTAIPMLTFSFNNFTRVKARSEMCFIGEMVVEKFKTDSVIILDYLNQLESSDSIEYIDDNFDKDKYSCTIYKIENRTRLIDIKVKVKEQVSSSYVEYMVSIPKK